MDSDGQDVARVAARVVAALGTELELHVEILKAETARDLSGLAKRIAPLFVGIPMLALGYVLVCVGIAIALAPWLEVWGGVAAVGLANILVGALLARRVVLQLSDKSASYMAHAGPQATSSDTTSHGLANRIEVSHSR